MSDYIQVVEKVPEHSFWVATPPFKALLRECMNKYVKRLNQVSVIKDAIRVTDGRRLLVLSCKHEMKPMDYFMTSEGILVPSDVENFPKIDKKVLPESDDPLQMGDTDWVFSEIMKNASKEIFLDVGMYANFIKKVSKLDPEEISYSLHPHKIKIEGVLQKAEACIFAYVQMDIYIDGKS
jgi:hypothetical protein